jgi:hypothetical protein
MKRVEKDPEGGWIARYRNGLYIPDAAFRWNSRSAARGAVTEARMYEKGCLHNRTTPSPGGWQCLWCGEIV